MSEHNNIYQLPKSSHSEDYLQSSQNEFIDKDNTKSEEYVALDFHRASERAISLEQVQAARRVNEIISQNEPDLAPHISLESAPNYMNDEEKLDYLEIKKISNLMQFPRKDMLDGAIVMSAEQETKYNKGRAA